MSIKQHAYHALRRIASQRQRDQIKARVSRFRQKLAPFLNKWHGIYGNAELEIELRPRIPADFDILMVHSSISSMQPMYQGTARDLLNFLLQFVGPERTLAMPAFFFGSPESFNRAYYRKHPRFDVRRTPSQMGLVTELFRRRPGVTRSLHPTHSVCALGPLAHELCATHHLSPFACGKRSPFAVMGRYKTVIVGLGVEYYRSLTQVHCIEDCLGDRFPLPRDTHEEPLRVEIVDRSSATMQYEMANPFSNRFVLRAERLAQFLDPSDIREWSFKGTTLYVTEASTIDRAILRGVQRGLTLYVPVSRREG